MDVHSTFVGHSMSHLWIDDSRLASIDSDVSRNSEISVQIYLRNGSASQLQFNAKTNDMGKSDIFMGNYKLVPDFESASAINEGWYNLVGGTGEINIQAAYVPSHVTPTL